MACSITKLNGIFHFSGLIITLRFPPLSLTIYLSNEYRLPSILHFMRNNIHLAPSVHLVLDLSLGEKYAAIDQEVRNVYYAAEGEM